MKPEHQPCQCDKCRGAGGELVSLEWDRAKSFRGNVDAYIDRLLDEHNIVALDMAVVALNTSVHRAQLLRNRLRAKEYGADAGVSPR